MKFIKIVYIYFKIFLDRYYYILRLASFSWKTYFALFIKSFFNNYIID